MRHTWIALLAITALVIAGIAVADEVTRKPLTWKEAMPTDGETLYTNLCAVCHGSDGTGNGPAVKALSIEVPDLTALAAGNDGTFPVDQVEKVISGETETAAHGSREMPMWGQAFKEVRPDWGQARGESFAQLRIGNLVSYIESMQAKAAE